jgi:LacI family transcriptional regulator
MRRVTIGDLARETGLSRATIDRVLNGRGHVHARTRVVVEQALDRLSTVRGTRRGDEPVSAPAFDLLMRVGRGMMDQMMLASAACKPADIAFHAMHQASEDDVLHRVRELCRTHERPLVLTAKNTAPLCDELAQARRRGKQVIALVSDLDHHARDAFVGIDDRMAGQTAAFVIGSLLAPREAKAGVVLGDYAFSCHEDREIGFRSNLRANFANIRVTDVAKGDDTGQRTYEAVRALLHENPDLDAIYNVAGGNTGLARALQESGRTGAIRVISHEANHVTVPLVRAGILQFVLAQDPHALLAKIAELLSAPRGMPAKERHHVDFGLHTRFNLPGYSLQPVD